MFFNFSLNLGFLALCLLEVYLSSAITIINQNERENLTRWQRDNNYNVSSAILKMTSRIPLNGTLGWKHFSYLQKHPSNYDVTFAVGPKKIIVRAPKLILTSASSVLDKEFESNWTQSVIKEGDAIPLPDLDPMAFDLFVQLTILDTWSVDALKALELPCNQLLHLMSICHKYGMTTALKNLTELATDFVKEWGDHVKPEEFFSVSQSQLELILASDDLNMTEIDVYHYACSWAEEQCRKQNMEVTGENLRNVLGDCLYQIRFPVMSIAEFTNVTRLEGLLSLEETVKIFQFIGTDKEKRKLINATELKFKFEQRRTHQITSVPNGSFTVSLAEIFPVVDAPFVSDGTEKRNMFTINNMNISLRGFGFLGPINADSFYDVTVSIGKVTQKSGAIYTDKIEKRIFAQKSKVFYFVFDHPIFLDINAYVIRFTLKGPNTWSLKYTGISERIHEDNFRLMIFWLTPQLVEILYDDLRIDWQESIRRNQNSNNGNNLKSKNGQFVNTYYF